MLLRIRGPVISIILIFLTTFCKHKIAPRFDLVSSKSSGIEFNNIISESDSFNILTYEYIYNGGGVGIGDFNNDGLQDVFFTGNMVSNELYLNKGNLRFQNITEEAQLTSNFWSTGVAIADVNSDGWQDIYVCVSGGYLNQEYDLPEKRKNKLYINLGLNKSGIPQFTEVAEEYGIASTGFTSQAIFFDFDRDYDLDLYLVNNSLGAEAKDRIREPINNGTAVSNDQLFRNDGKSTFTDVTKQLNIHMEGFGLSGVVDDFNNDNWPDIYVTNDYITNDLLYINKGVENGVHQGFEEKLKEYFKHHSHFSMGVDMADIDNDGMRDLISMDMMPYDNYRKKMMGGTMTYDQYRYSLKLGYSPQQSRNMLQLNGEHGKFSEIGQLAGIHETDWSWSVLLADYNNNGLRDIFITNGFVKDVTNLDFVSYGLGYGVTTDLEGIKVISAKLNELPEIKPSNFIYCNSGNLHFNDSTESWGIKRPSFSYGAAYADFDNDGDLDLITNNINDQVHLYRNNSERDHNNYIELLLGGINRNRNAIGSKVNIYYQGQSQVHFHSAIRGFQSSVSPVIHFGIGKHTMLDSIKITWPDGRIGTYYNISANQILRLSWEDAAEGKFKIGSKHNGTSIKDITDKYFSYTHIDPNYDDFKVQPLMIHKYSQLGPGIAIGDVNGDKIEDFYVAGAYNQNGTLFIQQMNGQFEKWEIASPGNGVQEETGVLLFDADNDGDLDLYVVCGGYEFRELTDYYRDLLYINDGSGNFRLDLQALPHLNNSGTAVRAGDYDRDGDLDLLVANGIVPGRYPTLSSSYILENNSENGQAKFTNVTNQVAPDLTNSGLLSDALWVDFNNDNLLDIVHVGEWQPITFLKNTGKQFKTINNSGLSNYLGWWNSIITGDFDNDGDTDFVVGNLGSNSPFKVSAEHPIRMYSRDFDNNGHMDPILSYFINDKEYPFHSKDELASQLTGIKKMFNGYHGYASITIKGLIAKTDLEKIQPLETNFSQSVYIENNGDGTFDLKKLPVEAQFAPIYGMIAGYFNDDNFLDILLTGNSSAFAASIGPINALNGLLLIGDGTGEFKSVLPGHSGFYVEGEGRGIGRVYNKKGEEIILTAQNNALLKAFLVKREKSNYVNYQPLDNDMILNIKYNDGSKQKVDLHHGLGYLSSSSRKLCINLSTVSSITATNYLGKERKIDLFKLKSSSTNYNGFGINEKLKHK